MLGHVYGLEGPFLQRLLVQRWCSSVRRLIRRLKKKLKKLDLGHLQGRSGT